MNAPRVKDQIGTFRFASSVFNAKLNSHRNGCYRMGLGCPWLKKVVSCPDYLADHGQVFQLIGRNYL